MKVIGLNQIKEFCDSHADVRKQFNTWLCEVEDAQWNTPHDVKERFVNASFLKDNRVIFNLKGNSYRLDTKISYKNQLVFIKRIGTHSEYSKWKF